AEQKRRIGNRLSLLASVQFGQLTPDLLLALGYFFGHIDLNNNVEIAAFPRDSWQATFTQTKPLPTLGAWRNFQAHLSLQCWHKQFGAKHCLPRLDFHLVNQIAAFNCEIRMSRQTHAKKEIAAFSAACARFALTAQADSLSFMNAARDLNLVIFDFI